MSGVTAGPLMHTMLMRQGAWIFEPYYRALKTGLYDLDGQGVKSVLTDQFERITAYLTGSGKTSKPEFRLRK